MGGIASTGETSGNFSTADIEQLVTSGEIIKYNYDISDDPEANNVRGRLVKMEYKDSHPPAGVSLPIHMINTEESNW